MDERERAEFRAFVREHHPDRGGDPHVFVAGLARFRAAAEVAATGVDGDGPIEVVASLPLPVRVAVALLRTARRRRRRRVH